MSSLPFIFWQPITSNYKDTNMEEKLVVVVSVYPELVYATREPPIMAQFDWFAISGNWAYPMIEISNSGYCVTVVSSR